MQKNLNDPDYARYWPPERRRRQRQCGLAMAVGLVLAVVGFVGAARGTWEFLANVTWLVGLLTVGVSLILLVVDGLAWGAQAARDQRTKQ